MAHRRTVRETFPMPFGRVADLRRRQSQNYCFTHNGRGNTSKMRRNDDTSGGNSADTGTAMTRPVADARSLLARSMREQDLLGFVLNAARDMGWRLYHSRPGMMRSGKWATPMQGHRGFPDLVLVKPLPGQGKSRLLFVELKSEKGKVEPPQHEWLQDLMMCPVEVYIWRPSDWQSGEILKVLKGESHDAVY